MPDKKAGAHKHLKEFEGHYMDEKTIEGLYSTIIQTSLDGFWMVDIHGHFLEVNDAYCKLIGYSREKLLQMSLTDVEVLENPEDNAAHVRKITKAGPGRFETRHRCSNGATVDLEVSVNYTDAGGGRLFAFLRDITGRRSAEEGLKRHQENIEELFNIRTRALQAANEDLKDEIRARRGAEEALVRNERWLRLMADSLPVLISYVDAERRYLFANRKYEQYFGVARDEINNRFVKDILGDEAYNGVAPYMDKTLAGEKITFERTFYFARSGETFLKVNYVPDFGIHGRVKGFFVLGYDITEHKKMEQLLRLYAKQLGDLEETQKRTLARELHDQVGPILTSLGLNLNLVRSGLPEDASELGARLDDSLWLVEQTAEYIRHVLTDLRPPLLDDYGLLTALRDYGEQFSARTAIEVEVQGEEPAQRPPLQVETGLFRVAQEAFTNVAKHAEAARVAVMVDRPNGKIRLIIEDNGKGFDSTRFRERDGSCGWGLITMSERVEAMGGTFRVDSALGRGTQIIAEVSL